jgi:protein-tyrosine kinase
MSRVMAHEDTFYALGLRVLNKLPSDGLGRVLTITSARQGEGKSHVARALAQALARQCSGPVALVHTHADKQDGPGWSDLVEEGNWPDGLPPVSADGELTLIGSGMRTRADTLFRPDAIGQALQCLRARFTFSVIDAPSLSACGVLPRAADGTLLVVNARNTRREIVQGALTAHPVPTNKLLGTVLNQRPEYVPAWLYRWML